MLGLNVLKLIGEIWQIFIVTQSRDKLRKIEALFAGAGTAGERLAAEAALGRVKARLAELGRRDPAIETQFSMPDQRSRQLFMALSRPLWAEALSISAAATHHGRDPGPERFHRHGAVAGVHRTQSSPADRSYEVTLRVIHEEIYSDASDAPEVPESSAAQLNGPAFRRRPSTPSPRARSSIPMAGVREDG